jgi:hypothetical protein
MGNPEICLPGGDYGRDDGAACSIGLDKNAISEWIDIYCVQRFFMRQTTFFGKVIANFKIIRRGGRWKKKRSKRLL